MDVIPPHLITYPRSGSHYFSRLIYKKANFHIARSHTVNWLLDKNNKKIKKIVTIARDPKESISSHIALEKHLWPHSPIRINEMITEYILLYNFLYEYADHVIDFQDLVDNPDAITEKVLSLLEINEENHYQFVTDINYDSKNYIKSSKVLKVYETVDLSNSNIDLCYFYYNRLLEKKIIV